MKRLAFLDNLKVAMTVLVIAHHLAITYGAEGSWYYYERPVEPLSRFLLTVFTAVNQSYFMGFFFFISGYFTPTSLDRKGTARFLVDRVVRLGIPLILFGLLVSPILEYVKSIRETHEVFLLGVCFRGYLAAPYFAPGPLWFAETLLLFSLGYALLRRRRASIVGAGSITPPIAALALLIGVATFLVRIWYSPGREWHHLQLAFFPQYLFLFFAGVIAQRRDLLARLPDRALRLWAPVAALSFGALLAVVGLFGGVEETRAVALGGARWQSLLWSTVEAFECVGICVSLLIVFRRRWNDQRPLIRKMTKDAFAVYVLHAPIIVLLAVAARGVALHPLLKFVAVTLVAVPVCFVIGNLFHRLSLAQRVFCRRKPPKRAKGRDTKPG